MTEQGFPKMQYEVLENGDTICLTDDGVSAAFAFTKSIQSMDGKIQDNPVVSYSEFKDHKDKKFVRVTCEVGNFT